MEKASKGPWKEKVEIRRRFDCMTGTPKEESETVVVDANGKWLCIVSDYDKPALQNAKLMAAAPEMFNLLIDASQFAPKTTQIQIEKLVRRVAE